MNLCDWLSWCTFNSGHCFKLNHLFIHISFFKSHLTINHHHSHLIHSSANILIHPFTHSSIHLFIHRIINSFNNRFIFSLLHTFIYSFFNFILQIETLILPERHTQKIKQFLTSNFLFQATGIAPQAHQWHFPQCQLTSTQICI